MKEMQQFIPDQTGKIPTPRIEIVKEAISGTAASKWQAPARERLETMVAQALDDVHETCGERWRSVSIISQDSQVHVIRQGELESPISILDSNKITQLDEPPKRVDITLKTVLAYSLQMLGSNLTTFAELQARQGKKGLSETPGRQGRTAPNRSGIVYRRAF